MLWRWRGMKDRMGFRDEMEDWTNSATREWGFIVEEWAKVSCRFIKFISQSWFSEVFLDAQNIPRTSSRVSTTIFTRVKMTRIVKGQMEINLKIWILECNWGNKNYMPLLWLLCSPLQLQLLACCRNTHSRVIISLKTVSTLLFW